MIDFASLRIEDYFRMLWRRKGYLFTTTFLVTGLFVGLAWVLPRVYKSQTTILVVAQGISEGYVKPTRSEGLEDRLNVISFQLKSRSLLERLIQEYKLYGYGADSRFNLEDALKKMRDDIEVNLGQHNTFTVGYYAPLAPLARDVTKRLADEVIRLQTTSREDQAVGTDQFIDDQLRQAEKELAANEEKLKAFKLQHLGALPEQSAGNLAALNGLHNQLVSNESAIQRAKDQQAVLEQRQQDLKNLSLLSQEVGGKAASKLRTGANSRITTRASLRSQLDAKLAQLAGETAKYTDKYPDVVRLKREIQELEQQLSQETATESAEVPSREGAGVFSVASDVDVAAIKTQLQMNKRDVASLEKEHEDILRQIQMYQARLNLSPRVEMELLSLTRDNEYFRQNYKNLQDKKFNTQVAANLEKTMGIDTFKIIDEAYLPKKPVKPDRRLISLIGLFAGMGFGLALIVFVEYLDPTLRDEDIATNELKLPVLISVPEIKKTGEVIGKTDERRKRLVKQA